MTTEHKETKRPILTWACGVCGKPWPLSSLPPDEAECDSCGGMIDVTDPYWRWAKS